MLVVDQVKAHFGIVIDPLSRRLLFRELSKNDLNVVEQGGLSSLLELKPEGLVSDANLC